MKEKRVRTILILSVGALLLCCLAYYLIFIHGFYAESDKVVGQYAGTADISMYENDEEWRIGVNKYGEPVFADPEKAFQLAQERFAEATELIYESFGTDYHLERISVGNYQIYKQLGWQIPVNDEAIRKQGVQLTQFLDVYENSYKRWVYVVGIGWERICPD